jgi:hypothetical protein
MEKIVNDSFNDNRFDGDIDVQNKLARKICQDIMKTKE